MVQKCCVRSCPSAALKGRRPKISFHKFPSDDIRRKQWLDTLHKSENDLISSKDLRVCSKHFIESDYIYGGNIRKLKNTAVPRLTEYEKIKQQKLNSNEKYEPKLWGFELLGVLTENNKLKREIEDSLSDSNHTDTLVVKQEIEEDFCDIKDEESDQNTLTQDIFDTIGKNVAQKLRLMNEEQMRIASKLFGDLLYHGLMEELTPRTQLLLCDNS